MTTPAIVNSGDIGDNELVTLSEACRLFFRGRLTKSSLRTEARKGNLEIIRVAGKDFVTKNGVERMVQRCREKNSPQGSGLDQTPEHGSSKTGIPVSPQNALRAMLQEPKKPSQPTSQKHTSPSAEVIHLR